MKKTYTKYMEIKKEILDSIKVGDYIKINDWKRPLIVRGVSKNYFFMSQNMFGKVLYSVCEKIPWGGIRYNAMRGGMFHCGTDNMVFGYCDFDYETKDVDEINQYLEAFENKTYGLELSHRTSVPIYELYVK